MDLPLVVCAMSADGFYVPPMFVFKRKIMNDRLLKHSPPGSVAFPSVSGWIDCDLFVRYLKHFIKCVKPNESNPVLLLTDGHSSHKSLEAVELARKHHVTMLTIPPHSSHRLQPLDLTFFGPPKTMYNRQMDKWMLSNPGKRVTPYELCEIFTPAYQHVASHEKAVKGFKCAGIVPYDPEVFSDVDFAPATVTELAAVDDAPPMPVQAVNAPDPVNTGHASNAELCTTVVNDNSGQSGTTVHVLDISPYPRVRNDGRPGQKRQAEASSVITSTPNKRLLEAKVNRDMKSSKPVAQKRLNLPKVSKKCGKQKAKKTVKHHNKMTEPSSCTAARDKDHSTHKTKQPRTVRRPRPVNERPPQPRKPQWLMMRQQSGRPIACLISPGCLISLHLYIHCLANFISLNLYLPRDAL